MNAHASPQPLSSGTRGFCTIARVTEAELADLATFLDTLTDGHQLVAPTP